MMSSGMVSLWVQPLLLLPGVALLIVSTSARYGQLHMEVHRLIDTDEVDALEHLLQRARHFRNALVLLYVSTALLAVSALAVGLLSAFPHLAWWVGTALLGASVLAVIGAAVELIREAVGVLEVLKSHAAQGHRRGAS